MLRPDPGGLTPIALPRPVWVGVRAGTTSRLCLFPRAGAGGEPERGPGRARCAGLAAGISAASRTGPCVAGLGGISFTGWQMGRSGRRDAITKPNSFLTVTKSKTAKERRLPPVQWPGSDSALRCVYWLTPISWSPQDHVCRGVGAVLQKRAFLYRLCVLEARGPVSPAVQSFLAGEAT